MRQYQRIWEQLKATGTSKILAPIKSHKRIIQAVRKERASDIGWRLMLLEKNKSYKFYKMKVTSENNTLTFILTEKL